MFKEFKKFITRGNVIDLAVGVIIGAAFNKIVSSLVQDIITPIISFFTSFLSVTGIDLNDWKIVLRKAEDGTTEIAISSGVFITYVIDFLITGFAVFLLVKGINKLSETKSKLITAEKEAEEQASKPEPEKTFCPFCKSEVNPEAVRCPFCTSELNAEKQTKQGEEVNI